jgi:Tfp pilus assembly protein PilV
VRTARRAQQGMTLLIALIMLVVITLFVVSMIRLGNTNSAIVGNMQAQKGIESEAQQSIETALNKYQFFDDAIQGAGAWLLSTTQSISDAPPPPSTLWSTYAPTGATSAPAKQADAISVYRPQCLYFEPSTGYSALSGIAPQDTYWDLKVTASDSKTGASTEIHQGIQMRLPAGNCK